MMMSTMEGAVQGTRHVPPHSPSHACMACGHSFPKDPDSTHTLCTSCRSTATSSPVSEAPVPQAERRPSLSSAQHRLCSNCDTGLASLFCKTCSVHLCKICGDQTHSARIFQSHALLPLLGDENGLCEKHNKPMEFFNFFESKLLCTACFYESSTSSGQECSSVYSARVKMIDQLQAQCAQLRDRIAARQAALDALKQQSELVLACKQGCLNLLDSSIEECVQKLKSRKELMAEELVFIFNGITAKASETIFSLSAHASLEKSTLSLAEGLLEKNPGVNALPFMNSLLEKLQDLSQSGAPASASFNPLEMIPNITFIIEKQWADILKGARLPEKTVEMLQNTHLVNSRRTSTPLKPRRRRSSQFSGQVAAPSSAQPASETPTSRPVAPQEATASESSEKKPISSSAAAEFSATSPAIFVTDSVDNMSEEGESVDGVADLSPPSPLSRRSGSFTSTQMETILSTTRSRNRARSKSTSLSSPGLIFSSISGQPAGNGEKADKEAEEKRLQRSLPPENTLETDSGQERDAEIGSSAHDTPADQDSMDMLNPVPGLQRSISGSVEERANLVQVDMTNRLLQLSERVDRLHAHAIQGRAEQNISGDVVKISKEINRLRQTVVREVQWALSCGDSIFGCHMRENHQSFMVRASARLDQLSSFVSHVSSFYTCLDRASIWPLCENCSSGDESDGEEDKSALSMLSRSTSPSFPPGGKGIDDSASSPSNTRVCSPNAARRLSSGTESSSSDVATDRPSLRSLHHSSAPHLQISSSPPSLAPPSEHTSRASKSQSPLAKKRSVPGSRLVRELVVRPRAHSVGPCDLGADSSGDEAQRPSHANRRSFHPDDYDAGDKREIHTYNQDKVYTY